MQKMHAFLLMITTATQAIGIIAIGIRCTQKMHAFLLMITTATQAIGIKAAGRHLQCLAKVHIRQRQVFPSVSFKETAC